MSNKKKVKFEYFLFLIPIILIIIENTNLNNDIWFILNHGRYVLEHGIPYIEPFTIHEGLSFVMQQWLTATIFWILYNYISHYALYFFIVIIGILILYFYYKLCLVVSDNKKLSIILSSLFVIMIKSFITSRPQIITYLLLIIELYSLEKYIKTKKLKNLYTLPIISLLLINMHASMWFMQFAFLLPFLINGIKLKKIKLGNYKLKPILIITIIMFLIGLINPYSINAITYIFKSFGISEINNYVSEMKPPNFNYLSFKYILASIFLLVFILNLKKKKLELRHLFLTFGTTILALMNVKSFPYFFITYLYIMSFLLKDFNIKKVKIIKNKYIKSIINGLKIGVAFMLVITFIYTAYQSSLIYEQKNVHYLKETVDVLLEDSNKKDIILYIGYNDGGYTEFRGIKSYIDPRAEVFLKKNNKKEEIFNEYYSMTSDDFDYEKFVDKYEFTHFIVDVDSEFDKYLKENSKYELIYECYIDDIHVVNLYKEVLD